MATGTPPEWRQRWVVLTIVGILVVAFAAAVAIASTPRLRPASGVSGRLVVGRQGAGRTLTSVLDTDGRRMRSGPATNASYSSNWSGLGGTGQGIEGVEGHWTVPSVDSSTVPGDSSSWVGVDGLDTEDTALIQTGTEQDTTGGYYAWWEILPHPAVRIVASHGEPAPVRPGDEITAVVNKTAQSGVWTIYIQDVTRNWFFEQQSGYSGPGRSAEWIEEAPIVRADQTALPDFRAVTFSGTAIYGSFGRGLRWYSTNLDAGNEIILRNAANTRTLARPSAPSVASALGQRFTDRYVAPPGPSGASSSTSPAGVARPT